MTGEQFEISAGNLDLSFVAENDLSTKQYYIVEMSAEDQVDVCDGAGDTPIGILQNKPIAGQRAIVRVFGVSRVVSDAALTVGQNVGTSADGQAVSKTANKDMVIGRVLVASGAAAEIATVTVDCMAIKQLNV